jgi:hypothetical protein
MKRQRVPAAVLEYARSRKILMDQDIFFSSPASARVPCIGGPVVGIGY